MFAKTLLLTDKFMTFTRFICSHTTSMKQYADFDSSEVRLVS